MHRISFFNLIFTYICFVQRVSSTTEMENTSTADPRQTKYSTRYYKLKYYWPGEYEVKRVMSLQSDLAQFVATQVRRETYKSTAIFDQRSKRGTYLPRNFTQSTKSTTRKDYSPKKHYPSRKIRRQILHAHLINIFSEFDDVKKTFFENTDTPPSKATICYMKAFSCFMSHCFYDHYQRNTGLKDVKNILARACMAKWLDTTKIIRIMKKCCRKRFKYYVPLPS